MPDRLATIRPKLPPVRAPNKPRRQLRIRGKLFHAIELIVFEGLDLQDAAAKAGLTTFQLRQAFGRPHVLAHIKARREVLRASVCGSNILRLQQIRDAANNMPAVHAIRDLEQIGDDEAARNPNKPSPGIVIHIVSREGYEQANARRPVTIDAKPMPAFEDMPKRDAVGDPIFDPRGGGHSGND